MHSSTRKSSNSHLNTNNSTLQYTFHSLAYNGTKSAPWEYVRNWTDTEGWFDKEGIQYFTPLLTDKFNSVDLRCNIKPKFAPGTLAVKAGTDITFDSADYIWHSGPLMAYMAKVPKGKMAANWDGSGKVVSYHSR